MKITYLILSLTLVFGINSVRANFEENINSNARRNFEQEFTGAKNTNWSITGNLTKATFNLHGQEWYAFYSQSGERLALARNLQVSSLPINLIKEVRSSYKAYWITAVFEVSNDNDSAYYITLENADEKVTLKSVGTTEWLRFKTASKE